METDNAWHSASPQWVADQLKTDLSHGLEKQDIAIRQEKYGLNKLAEQQGDGPLKRFLLQFNQPLIYILLVAVVVTLVLQEYVDSAVILAVVLINAGIGFVQEAKALQAINSLSEGLTTEATVIRSGQRQTLPADQLVAGDLVVLQAGDKVAADLRLIKVRNLQIDESSLTGESMPSEKTAATLEPDSVLGDRQNMAYSSTLVTYGTGLGVVTEIGAATEIGKISTLIATTETLETPLTKRIKQFSRHLLYVIAALCALTLALGWLYGKPALDAFMSAVALAVSAIPEGLPATVTIMLAIGVSRLAKRRAIIRNLPAVETLGSTTVICSDKTGTLTKNEMTVQTLWAGGQKFKASGNGYNPDGKFQFADGTDEQDLKSNSAALETLKAGLYCNEADLLAPDEEQSQWRISGDPTEGALLVAARKAGLDSATSDGRLDIIPFQSEFQYMATLHSAGEHNRIYLKGSIERVLPKCKAVLDGEGKPGALDADHVHQLVEDMAADGLRVLAFARRNVIADQHAINHDDINQSFEFLGLQAMIDPPRQEAAAAVAACHRAGIAVKMITGDHILTATSIARKLSIVAGNDQESAVTGHQLAKAEASQLSAMARQSKVFGRVSPENKLALVEALQSEGHVVAMTGDGVNDAPALRRADIGVAMAMNGTEVAREAADMMLTDDNFATVQAAVEEGRGIFDNLKKFITWTLPTNGGEALVILLAVLLGISLPLLPVHILWVNMTTAVCLGLMLAFEPKEADIMQRPPNGPHAPILSSVLVWRIVLVSSLLCLATFGLYQLELWLGASETEARTVAVAMFVVGEAFYLMNCRSLERSVLSVGLFSNVWIWLGIVVMFLLQMMFTYLPLMNAWFQSAPIALESWLRVLACSLLIMLIVEFEKRLRRRSADSTTGNKLVADAG